MTTKKTLSRAMECEHGKLADFGEFFLSFELGKISIGDITATLSIAGTMLILTSDGEPGYDCRVSIKPLVGDMLAIIEENRRAV